MTLQKKLKSHMLLGTAIVVVSIWSPLAYADGPFEIRMGSDRVQEIHESMTPQETEQYLTDVALERAQIQIRQDNEVVEPALNVTTEANTVTMYRGETLNFYPFWNYGAFIDWAEIRIFKAGNSVRSEPLKIIPVDNGIATLDGNLNLPDELTYVLRVYDKNSRFDETQPKFLNLLEQRPAFQGDIVRGSALEGYGIDRTAVRNIKIKGSSVTVYGRDVPADGQVNVMGTQVPVDLDGKFMREMILSYGDHQVDVSVEANGQSLVIERDVFLDKTNVFYVALGDLTLGTNSSVGPADFLSENDEDFDDVGVYGRGAMYAKGVIGDDYRVTAAIDTGEDRIEDLFSNLDEKDPRQLLRRLDGDRFYPAYGDDSQITEDAPTQGRFYVKVEKDSSHVMWGNFATQITGTEFAHLDRGLYGGIADIRSNGTNSTGDRNTHITAFAADPGTVPAREEFRGTGGSLYFLQRQDISIGSERVRVEVRDKVSGLVVETRNLRPQDDYDVDYIQGRIVLSSPLQSFVKDNEFVRTSSLSGNEAYLVVRYEYSPSLANVDGYTLGGRATQWVGDHVRIGGTAQRETTDVADQTLYGVDALIRSSDDTYLKLEYAQTKGPGFGQSNSVDGGFNFDAVQTTGVQNVKAEAYRVEAAANLSDILGESGRIQAYYDHQDTGFSGTGRLIQGDLDRWGGALSASISKDTTLNVKYDEIQGELIGDTQSIYGDFSHKIGEDLTLSVGIRHDDRNLVAIGNLPAVDGSRTDATVQADLRVSQDVGIHGFVQQTLDNDATRLENDRYGIGADVRLTERLTLSGEVSDGDLGFGAQGRATFQRSDNTEMYLGYALSPDNRTTGLNTQIASNDGMLTVGGRHRFSDTLSVYGEERFGHGRGQRSLTHAYGLDFAPNEHWSFGIAAENGTVEERRTGESFERTAVTFSAGRASEKWRLASSLEGRFEDSNGGVIDRDRQTWLMRNTVSYDANEDWEVLGRLNFAVSESDQTSFRDADFVEGVLGAAYRPVENDRLNALVKYTYFEDLAPAGQITAGGTIESSRQKSQIFSVDAIYDLTEKLSIGGKYGYRMGKVAFDRTGVDIAKASTDTQYIESDAHLAVIRMDYHVAHKWDVLAEGRVLGTKLSDEERFGALAGIYRHVGENVKVGAGYSFSKFSDDLTDFENDSEGFFLNVLGKF